MITSETRHLTASAVVLDVVDLRVLLVHHKAVGRWVFPGGHWDEGEALHETAAREVLEETGIVIRIGNRPLAVPGTRASHPTPIRVDEYRAPAKPDRPGKPAEPEHWHIDHLFLAYADSADEIVTAPGEVHGARWVRISELESLDVRDEVPIVARRAVQGWH